MVFNITQNVSINPETREVITGKLDVCLYESIHYSFDNYLLVHAYPKSEALNPFHDRICFLAQRLPEGTLPGEDIREDASKPYYLCVMDLANGEIVAEIPIREPFDFKWDKRTPIPNPEMEEYERARAHMNTAGKVGPDDPINDPERLEYYLFYYDPRYVRESPMEYATRMRDQYRKMKAKSMNYQEPKQDPGEEPEPETGPDSTQKDKPASTPTQGPAPKRTNWWLIMLPFAFVFLMSLLTLLFRNH